MRVVSLHIAADFDPGPYFAPLLKIPPLWLEFVRGLNDPAPCEASEDPAAYAQALEELWRRRGICTCPPGQPCRRVAQLMQEGTEAVGCISNGCVDAANAGPRGIERDDEVNAGRVVANAEMNRRDISHADGVDRKGRGHLTISIVGCSGVTIEAGGWAVMARPLAKVGA